MTHKIKTKTSFGTATIDHFSPAKQEEWPTAAGWLRSARWSSGFSLFCQPKGWTPTPGQAGRVAEGDQHAH